MSTRGISTTSRIANKAKSASFDQCGSVIDLLGSGVLETWKLEKLHGQYQANTLEDSITSIIGYRNHDSSFTATALEAYWCSLIALKPQERSLYHTYTASKAIRENEPGLRDRGARQLLYDVCSVQHEKDNQFVLWPDFCMKPNDGGPANIYSRCSPNG